MIVHTSLEHREAHDYTREQMTACRGSQLAHQLAKAPTRTNEVAASADGRRQAKPGVRQLEALADLMRLMEGFAEYQLGTGVVALRQRHTPDLQRHVHAAPGVEPAQRLARLVGQPACLGEIAAHEQDLRKTQQSPPD